MRRILAALVLFLPTMAAAEDIVVPSAVTRATLYPDGAALTRLAEAELPAGSGAVIVTGLPRGLNPDTLRVSGAGDFQIGAVSYRDRRLPPRAPEDGAAIEAARAEIARLEAAIREATAEIGAIRLRIDAARARLDFLSSVGASKAAEPLAGTSPAEIRDLARMLGEETLAARSAAHAAEQEIAAAERARAELDEELAEARAALEALTRPAPPGAALRVEVRAAAATSARLEIRYQSPAAAWQPVYDLRLSRGETATLELVRGALVRQATGGDWTGVALTLSTARPSGQTGPSEVMPRRLRIGPPVTADRQRISGESEMLSGAAEPAQSAPAADAIGARTEMQGLTVVYRYPDPVDVASGAEAARLALDRIALAPDLTAVAAPRLDATAYLVAEAENASGELILPGPVSFYMDGAFVGSGRIGLWAGGETARFPFGPIEGLRLSRRILERLEGDRGVISRSNRVFERAEIAVENLTDRAWPVQLRDRVPYSEQEDLRIDYTAEPPADTADPDGLRGVLEWRFEIAPGGTRTIRLEHEISWPEGDILR